MPRLVPTLLLATALVAEAPTEALALSAPDPARQPKTAEGVAAAETAWVEALKARDAATLRRLLDPSFIDTTWRGELRDKAAALAATTSGGAGAQAVSGLSVSLYGDVAIARGLNTVRDPDGAVAARIRFTDVFVYRDDGWRAVSAQETLEQAPGAQASATLSLKGAERLNTTPVGA